MNTKGAYKADRSKGDTVYRHDVLKLTTMILDSEGALMPVIFPHQVRDLMSAEERDKKNGD